jgi:hypothetical protein
MYIHLLIANPEREVKRSQLPFNLVLSNTVDTYMLFAAPRLDVHPALAKSLLSTAKYMHEPQTWNWSHLINSLNDSSSEADSYERGSTSSLWFNLKLQPLISLWQAHQSSTSFFIQTESLAIEDVRGEAPL